CMRVIMLLPATASATTRRWQTSSWRSFGCERAVTMCNMHVCTVCSHTHYTHDTHTHTQTPRTHNHNTITVTEGYYLYRKCGYKRKTQLLREKCPELLSLSDGKLTLALAAGKGDKEKVKSFVRGPLSSKFVAVPLSLLCWRVIEFACCAATTPNVN